MHFRKIALIFISAAAILSCSGNSGNQTAGNESVDQSESTALHSRLFEPGVISTGLNERDASFSPDGDEMYFTIWMSQRKGVIVRSTQQKGIWQTPEVVSFSGIFSDLEPSVSPDGEMLYFVSNRPLHEGEKTKDYDIWAVKKTGAEWGEPWNLGSSINTGKNEFYPSVTKDGTIYFTAEYENSIGGEDIFYSRRSANGQYEKPQNVGSQVNSNGPEYNAYVAPDESFLIFGSWGRKDGLGGGDLYISYRENSGNWTKAKNMGKKINSTALDYCPGLSPNGEYFFFTSQRFAHAAEPEKKLTYSEILAIESSPQNGNGDIYRIKASILDSLREE